MIKYYITDKDKKIKEIEKPQNDCWIHLESPNTEEIQYISELTGIEEDTLVSVLDENEVAHLDFENNYRVIVVDIPTSIHEHSLDTRPLALISTKEYLVSVCGVSTQVLRDFFEGKVKNLNTFQRNQLVYQIMLRSAKRFLYYLRQIDKTSDLLQRNLAKSMKNKEVLELLEVQKSLVFFSASLSADYAVIQKLLYHSNKANEDEREILEDVVLETKQATEMCSVYREIIKSTMDAFGSVVNNNQNRIMKFLAAITIILSIPMVIGAWWGMNTAVPWEGEIWGFWIAVGISLFMTGIAMILMIWKKMF